MSQPVSNLRWPMRDEKNRGLLEPRLRLHLSDQLCVQFDLGVVGEELRNRAAGLGVGSGLVESLLGSAGNLGGGGQRDLGDRESRVLFGQCDGRLGLDLLGCKARAANL